MKALIAIDGSTESEAAVEMAAGLKWPPGSRVEVLTVLPSDIELYGGPLLGFADVDPKDDLHRQLERDGRRLLDGALLKLGRLGLDISARSPYGRPATAIVDQAAKMPADLIVLGACGHGTLERALIGSVSAEVVDHAHCPVLVARAHAALRILVATDGSDDAMSAVSFIANSGLFRSAEVRVVHALDLRPAWWLGFTGESPTGASEAYEVARAAGRERAAIATAAACAALEAVGFEVTTTVREGVAAPVIVDEAATWQADLVVVGTRGHGLIRRLVLGSTARSVLQGSTASVLITRSTRPVASGEHDH